MTKRTSPPLLHLLSIRIFAGACAGLAAGLFTSTAEAIQIRLDGPPGSEHFGSATVVLPNGNIVVSDPEYDAPGPVQNVGAVYLLNGSTLEVISVLTGSQAGDLVGGIVTVLSDGNYVIASARWANGTNSQAGAVTWGSAVTGVSGTVSPANSVVGSHPSDRVGYGEVRALAHGHCLVCSPDWDYGTVTDAGAVTWIPAGGGLAGPVSTVNSLTGGSVSDRVGEARSLSVLPNGNYLVSSQYWDNGPAMNAGAVTWGDGLQGVSGIVSPANSLVGTTEGDSVGAIAPAILGNSHYLVSSPWWDHGSAADAGAVTWGSGTAGVAGPVSVANSLTGSQPNDNVGRFSGSDNLTITLLTNGNYTVSSPYWDRGAVKDAGAVTWGNGSAGVKGVVSETNSLVGSSEDDLLGLQKVMALNNGDYVVLCARWDAGAFPNAGAATWADGTNGIHGEISESNSLVGTRAYDNVGSFFTQLTNGNYVVVSPVWANGTAREAGAVTWCSGTAGRTGAVTPANSLVGSREDDDVGRGGVFAEGNGVTALTNGHYVVSSPYWTYDDDTGRCGAVTWGDGTAGITGPVSRANSLTGDHFLDQISSSEVAALSNGNYVVASEHWNSDAGAATWCDGSVPTSALVAAGNSLVGTGLHDYVGRGLITRLTNGNYVVHSPYWHQSTGAVTWGSGTTGVSGIVSSANSLTGRRPEDGVGTSLALKNGNYLVRSPGWKNGPLLEAAGAVTWGSGTTGVRGEVSAANSLIGSEYGDRVGYSYYTGGGGVKELSNGHYFVNSPNWSTTAVGDRGAFTWGSGTAGVAGEISATNSLLDTTALSTTAPGNVAVSVTEMEGGLLVLHSGKRGHGTLANVGAVTLLDGNRATSGSAEPPDTVFGTMAGFGDYLAVSYDPPRSRIVVSHWAANWITVLSLGNPILKDWSTANFGNVTALTDPLDDFEGDGVPNLMEFAFGTSPRDREPNTGELKYTGSPQGGGTLTATGLPVIATWNSPEGPKFQALFVRRRDFLPAGLTYTPQFSTNLNSWQDNPTPPTVLASNATHQIVSIPWLSGSNSPLPRFFRVQVNLSSVTRR